VNFPHDEIAHTLNKLQKIFLDSLLCMQKARTGKNCNFSETFLKKGVAFPGAPC